MLFGMSTSVQNIFDFVGANIVAVERDDRPVNLAGDSICVMGVMGVMGVTTRWGKITTSTVVTSTLAHCPASGASERLLRRLLHRYSRVPVAVS